MKYELQSTRHAKYVLHTHLMFTPKYRKKIFTKAHLDLMKEVFDRVCKEMVRNWSSSTAKEITFIYLFSILHESL